MITLDTPLKFTAVDGGPARHITDQQWSLPDADTPGEWAPKYKTKPILHERGYYWCEARHAIHHLHVECYLFEPWGETVRGNDENVSQGGRLLRRVETWNDRTARLFAADCAETVAHLCGGDPRPREAIEIARRYVRGQATEAELAAAHADAKIVANRAHNAMPRAQANFWYDPDSVATLAAVRGAADAAACAAADPAAHVTRAAFHASRQVIGAAYAATRVTRAALTALREAQNKLLLRYLNGGVT